MLNDGQGMKNCGLALSLGLVSLPVFAQTEALTEETCKEALFFYQKGIDQGDAKVQYLVGQLYEQWGCGGEDRLAQAKAWYEKAVAQGHEEAQKAQARLKKAEEEQAAQKAEKERREKAEAAAQAEAKAEAERKAAEVKRWAAQVEIERWMAQVEEVERLRLAVSKAEAKAKADRKLAEEKKLAEQKKREANEATIAQTPAAAASRVVSGVSWSWPANGKIMGNFAETKGIDIAGKAGDAVLAAADGYVVYTGNDLRGYGNLVIIKHNDKYSTAYAHNQKILVKEQQKVIRGAKIVEMGKTDSDVVKLHFEVRQQGKSVDPLNFLPQMAAASEQVAQAAAKDSHRQAQGFSISEAVLSKYPELVQLVSQTESMDDEEKQYWFDIMPAMTEKQIARLFTILKTEKDKLNALEEKYIKEIQKLNQ
ncbi:hypothetical protein AGMMS50289_04130 [Betaproteobacteria bacterium]|nr:hypothetical protein AGMMS50289_04130 [Betaproteobacteria bacterium]